MTIHRVKGKINRDNGELFEKAVETSCNMYAVEGKAYIQKTPEPMKIIKPLGNGRYEAVFTGAAQPDFKGCLRGGHLIVFDAKHTSTNKIRQSVITEMQEMYFESYQKMGAKCFVLVSMGLKDFFRVPWSTWKLMAELFGHKHMTVDDLEPFRVPGNSLKVRFLEGMII